MIGQCLNDEILAHDIALEEDLLVHTLCDVLLGQERQTHMLHEQRGELFPHRNIVAQPGDDALVYALLIWNRNPVVANQADDLLVREVQKLIELDHLAANKPNTSS